MGLDFVFVFLWRVEGFVGLFCLEFRVASWRLCLSGGVDNLFVG